MANVYILGLNRDIVGFHSKNIFFVDQEISVLSILNNFESKQLEPHTFGLMQLNLFLRITFSKKHTDFRCDSRNNKALTKNDTFDVVQSDYNGTFQSRQGCKDTNAFSSVTPWKSAFDISWNAVWRTSANIHTHSHAYTGELSRAVCGLWLLN